MSKVKLEIEIETGNAAFEDDPDHLGDLLKSAVNSALGPKVEGLIWDYNGNRVGSWRLTQNGL